MTFPPRCRPYSGDIMKKWKMFKGFLIKEKMNQDSIRQTNNRFNSWNNTQGNVYHTMACFKNIKKIQTLKVIKWNIRFMRQKEKTDKESIFSEVWKWSFKRMMKLGTFGVHLICTDCEKYVFVSLICYPLRSMAQSTLFMSKERTYVPQMEQVFSDSCPSYILVPRISCGYAAGYFSWRL